jgi:hypothetical protein
MSSEVQLIPITIRLTTGDKYQIVVRYDDTIRKLKEVIGLLTKKQVGELKFLYAAKVLDNDKTVMEYRLEPDSMLTCLVMNGTDSYIRFTEETNDIYDDESSDDDEEDDKNNKPIELKIINHPIFEKDNDDYIKQCLKDWNQRENNPSSNDIEKMKKSFNEMGWKEDEVKRALEITNNDYMDALEYLTEKKEQREKHELTIKDLDPHNLRETVLKAELDKYEKYLEHNKELTQATRNNERAMATDIMTISDIQQIHKISNLTQYPIDTVSDVYIACGRNLTTAIDLLKDMKLIKPAEKKVETTKVAEVVSNNKQKMSDVTTI